MDRKYNNLLKFCEVSEEKPMSNAAHFWEYFELDLTTVCRRH